MHDIKIEITALDILIQAKLSRPLDTNEVRYGDSH